MMNHLKELKTIMRQVCEKEFEGFVDLSHYLYEHPELGGEEYLTSKYLAEYLEKKGFRVSFPYEGLPTAFNAEYGPEDAEVTIAFLAEYDALPGFGPDGGLGQACGHN